MICPCSDGAGEDWRKIGSIIQYRLISSITEYGNDEPHLGMNQGGEFLVLYIKMIFFELLVIMQL